ncbi:MAG TPA: YggS family pyridoxal phosphate-dependent enzyme [Nitrospira sp.]|nr:YggS family pyridoxal phosphate-dependent enzyme [Nitrospira sp.]
MDDGAQSAIPDRIQLVLDRIDRAVHVSGRRAGCVRLVAATKTVPVDAIREAASAGLRFAGESRLQEALPKIQALREEPLRWHFIGRLQRRKVRDIVGKFELIHSVDSVELAREIDRRAGSAGVRQAVLLEVNVGGEAAKGGFRIEELSAVLPRVGELPHIKVMGLMAIPPQVDEAERARPYFRRMRELAEELSQLHIPAISMDELSMGMSDDYIVAIEEGATIVRVGTAIFGARRT